MHLLSAYAVGEGQVLAQVAVGRKEDDSGGVLAVLLALAAPALIKQRLHAQWINTPISKGSGSLVSFIVHYERRARRLYTGRTRHALGNPAPEEHRFTQNADAP